MTVFADRKDAGQRLAAKLEFLRGEDIVVLGLPRGGVPVAYEVAQALDAPLDVIVVRKLGLPFQPELAMGAIGEGGARVLDAQVLRHAQVREEELGAVEVREREQLEARVHRFRRGRERVDLHGRIAVVVDDGMATGSTARVACRVARHLGATKVVLAVPVAASDTVARFAEADQVVCVSQPDQFLAVGYHYQDFSPTSDDEVVVLLDAAARRLQAHRQALPVPDCDIDVQIPADGVVLEGHLHLPEPAAAVVVFAHGSGSSRHSPRNRFVASVLYEAGLGTLLLDLLTNEEEADRGNVFDLPLLARRLVATTEWLATRPDTASCRVGYFGASTGAGAALMAATQSPRPIAAVVSRGGRPDLAGDALPRVQAPTLLIVGGDDETVLELNRRALAQLACPRQLAIVEGATHLFEESGTLSEAAILARDWFVRYLLPDGTEPGGLS